MARPTISYNAGSGDSDASGSGGTKTTGSSATVSGGDPGTLISLDGSPDLSIYDVDTTAIWLDGIGIYRITAIDNGAKTVTIHDSVSLGGGVAWGIGGTRDNPRSDSISDEATGEAGWTYEFASGTYDCGASSFDFPQGDQTDGYVIIKAASGFSTKPIFTSTSATSIVVGGFLYNIFENIEFYCDIDNSYGVHVTASTFNLKVINCKFSQDPTNTNCIGLRSTKACYPFLVLNCEFVMNNAGGYGLILAATGNVSISIIKSIFHNCGAYGAQVAVTSALGANVKFVSCSFYDNSIYGLYVYDIDSSLVSVTESVFYNNGQHAIGYLSPGSTVASGLSVINCIFSNNTQYGLYSDTAANGLQVDSYYNAFYNNTSGSYSNVSDRGYDVELSANPFVDPANANFSLNQVAGGGLSCRKAGMGGIDIGLPAPTPVGSINFRVRA